MKLLFKSLLCTLLCSYAFIGASVAQDPDEMERGRAHRYASLEGATATAEVTVGSDDDEDTCCDRFRMCCVCCLGSSVLVTFLCSFTDVLGQVKDCFGN